jgi:hypothetical protein
VISVTTGFVQGYGKAAGYGTGHLKDRLNSVDTSVTLLRFEESKKFIIACKFIASIGRKHLL